MTMRNTLVGALLAATLVLTGGPAWAHEEIIPPTIPTGKANFVILQVANEARGEMSRLSLTAPENVNFGDATRQPAGWTAEKSEKVITWTGGALAPGAFDAWGVELEAVDQPGPLRFRVASSSGGGSPSTSTVEIAAVAPGTTPTTAAVVSVTTTGNARSMTTTDTAAAGTTAGGDDSGSSRANLALVVGALALALALVALAAALRGRGGVEEAKTW